MADIVSIDFETRGTANLPKCGAEVYAAHTDTDIWCLAFTTPDMSVDVWTPDMRVSPYLAKHVSKGGLVTAWNCAFEIAIWNSILAPRYGYSPLNPNQVIDTMAMAQARGYPGGLDDCAMAMALPVTKDKVGHSLMMRMCKPRSISPEGVITWWDDQERISRLIDYCRRDVIVERTIFNLLPPLLPDEQLMWTLNHRINQRGIHVDMDLVNGAESVMAEQVDRLNKELKKLTRGVVSTATNVAKLRLWLGLFVPDMPEKLDKAVLRELLARQDLHPDARRALEIRAEIGKSSAAKIKAMKTRAGEGDRLRGMFRFHGAASTGRWTSQGVQLQNLPRASVSPPSVLDLMAQGDWEGVNLLSTQSVMSTVSASLRSMLTATPGKYLLIADYAQIESRFTAWLANDQDKLDVFRQGRDIYQQVGAGMYGIPEDQVKGDFRQAAKCAELACGYGGGQRALEAIATAYALNFTEEEREEIVSRWRTANPKSKSLWYELKEAAFIAMKCPGSVMPTASDRVAYLYKNGSLRCRLPSGRVINYPDACLVMRPSPWDREQEIEAIEYAGQNIAKQWVRRIAWHGILTENVVQAACADLLRSALVGLAREGFDIVAHVHDEVIVEDADVTRLDSMIDAMTRVPDWAKGLPLDAEGSSSFRYKK